MSEYSYNGLGQLSSKSYHNASADSLYYTYNVRGWLTGIYGEKFVEGVNYSGLYNGNIRSINWGTLTNRQSYTYIYDGLNRLTEAIHSGNRFNEKVTEYDKNGNIKKLQRYGQTGANSYGLVDNLTYTYNGNKVTRVDDATTATSYTGGTNFINGANTNNEYTYDANGNLTKDLNKNITNIQYNLLNLPSVVTFSDGSTITYTYTHDGKKLRTVHVIGSTTTTTDYCGNVIYENGTPKRLLTDEGYVDLTTNTYYYYLKDHQGNNRAVVNASASVKETNHYYPFGGLFSTSTNVQPYKYNGKELDTKKGLNWYDYGARHYDAALGRWHVVDPMAEKYYSTSSYEYCLSNPIKYVDLNGESTWVVSNADGTYRIVGGSLVDNDKNIYVYSIQDNQLFRGESIGITTSITSFYNSDANNGNGAWAIGTIIDPNDKSGDAFLFNIIENSPTMLDEYAVNARNNHKYDFKATNGTDTKIEGIDYYRGMPIGVNKRGQIIYTSARDVGNIAAGYIAGSNGMSWAATRIAFDAYQGNLESISTRNAEYYGWRMGYNRAPNVKMNNFYKSIRSLLNRIM